MVAEIVGAGVGGEGVGALEGVAAPVDREGAGDLPHGGEDAVDVVERVGRTHRAGHGVVGVAHPGRLGILHPVGGRHPGPPGRDIDVLRVFEEIEPRRSGAVVAAQVVKGPAQVLRRGFREMPRVAQDASLDAADACGREQFRPGGERLAQAVRMLRAGPGRGVSPAQDVEVALEHAVLEGAGIGQLRLETVVRSERVQGHARGQELDVGGGDHPGAEIDRGEGVAVRPDGQHAHQGGAQRLPGADLFDGLLRLRPGNTSSRAPAGKQKRDRYQDVWMPHLTASFTAALSFS